MAMLSGFTHSFSGLTHNPYIVKPRAEQGFYQSPTENQAGYYDYLYIHTSSYANNLSTHHKTLKKKSRG